MSGITETFDLTAASLETFKIYAEDAANWSGTPWVQGNVSPTKAQRGNLSDLVKKGLIAIEDCEGKGRPKDMVVVFTATGKALAESLGISLT